MGSEYAGHNMEFIGTVVLACLIFLIAILILAALFVLVTLAFATVGVLHNKFQSYERFKKIRQDKW